MKRRLFPAVALWALAAIGPAQDIQMGYPPYYAPTGETLDATGVQTFVDLSAPATATGRVDTAFIGWSATPCPVTVKIKVFRRTAETLAFVAERGPLNVLMDGGFHYMTVALEPPIDVAQGDLLGLSRVSDCGAPLIYPDLGPDLIENPTEGLLRFEGDLTSNVALAAGGVEAQGFFLGVYARGLVAVERVARLLPVAGSSPGAFGSYFRTAMQLSNPTPFPLSGRLVFHRGGNVSSADDPSLPYTVAPFSTFFDDDVVAAMGQTGVGTIDVVVPTGTSEPLITARVYADAEEGGSFGFTEDGVDPTCCGQISIGRSGYLIAPSDPHRFRFNVGVRALFKAPTLTFRLLGPDGATLREATRSYPPSSFRQEAAEALFGTPIPASAQIVVESAAGTAIVYGAAVDNVTNDPSLQYLRFY